MASNIRKLIFLILAFCFFCVQSADAATLVGWAEMPMHTYLSGPTSGQFYREGNIEKNQQPVQGFSAVLPGLRENHFYFLSDNGYGKQNNSADALLKLYELEIEFADRAHKTNAVRVVQSLNFNDAQNKLGFGIQAEQSHYYGLQSNPQTDAQIAQNRWLTGADLDPESMAIDAQQHIWLGDEFGPFLIELDNNGSVISPAIALPNMQAPESPFLAKNSPNIASSAGFEAMCINTDKTALHMLLETPINGDAAQSLRLYTFDIASKKYQDGYLNYPLTEAGNHVTDIVAVSNTQLLVLERNDATTVEAHPFKQVFLVDIAGVKAGQTLKKSLVADLMQLDDPDDINQDGNTQYNFAYSHIEALALLDGSTLLVSNDNNYAGRSYFIKVKLNQPLALVKPVRESLADSGFIKSTGINTSLRIAGIDFGDHSFFGWMTVLAYLITSTRLGLKSRLAWLAKRDIVFWLGLTLLVLFLGINKQLDLQTNLTDYLRAMAKNHGWYEQRRPLQLAFVALMGLALPVLFFMVRVTLSNLWHRFKIMWIGLILLLVFVVIRAASFHHVDMFFYNSLGSLRYYQALELMAIAVIFVGSFYENTHQPAPKKWVPAMPLAVDDVVRISQDGQAVACPKCGTQAVAEAIDGRKFKCKRCGHKYSVHLIAG